MVYIANICRSQDCTHFYLCIVAFFMYINIYIGEGSGAGHAPPKMVTRYTSMCHTIFIVPPSSEELPSPLMYTYFSPVHVVKWIVRNIFNSKETEFSIALMCSSEELPFV